jgi:hypothetical protein
VVENVFSVHGRAGHEIVFVYTGRPDHLAWARHRAGSAPARGCRRGR